ncbi:MAG TPA: hypothetical protein VFN78_10520 [Ktedonobacterales bacterium]|nr:hypothetical protein [Ktedonobacterales bacterium]
MGLRLDPQGDGGLLRAAWRAICRAAEIPGEHSLPDTLRRARAASGRGDPESQWALRQYEALRQNLEHEKQALTHMFAMTILVFWGLVALTARQPGGRRLWTLVPLNGALTLGIGLRIWMVNALLRRFWERPADE